MQPTHHSKILAKSLFQSGRGRSASGRCVRFRRSMAETGRAPSTLLRPVHSTQGWKTSRPGSEEFHSFSTSRKGAVVSLIWKGFLAASSRTWRSDTKRFSMETLPKPLPSSSRPELRSAAATSEIVGPALLPIWMYPGSVIEALLHDSCQQGFGGRAPQVVEDHVNFPGQFGTKGGDERVVVLVERDDSVGAARPGFFKSLGIAAHRDDALRTEATGNLHSHLPCQACGAEDQNAFAHGKVGAVFERGPGRHGGIHHGGDGGVVERIGNGRAQGGPGDAAFSEGAKRRPHGAKENTRSVGSAAHAVDTRNERQLSGAAVVGSFGEGFDDGMQTCGRDVDEDFPFARDRIGEGRIAGRLFVRLDDGGVHGNLSPANTIRFWPPGNGAAATAVRYAGTAIE